MEAAFNKQTYKTVNKATTDKRTKRKQLLCITYVYKTIQRYPVLLDEYCLLCSRNVVQIQRTNGKFSEIKSSFFLKQEKTKKSIQLSDRAKIVGLIFDKKNCENLLVVEKTFSKNWGLKPNVIHWLCTGMGR